VAKQATQRVGQITRFNIPISVGIFGLSAIIVVVFVALFYEFPTYNKDITFLALAATAAGGIGGAFYVGKSLALQLEQQQRMESFSLIARWNSPDHFYARSACYQALSVYDASKKSESVTALLKQDPKVAENARQILNFLEEIAIAVRVGHVDGELTAAAFAGLVKRVYAAFQPWINEHRSVAGRQKIWSELEGLYERWKTR
jgi:hypothetical protein